jgi:hypothetical protein
MRTIRTSEVRERFLEGLRETGNVRAVCKALNLGRTALYAWKDEDPAFDRDWEAALQLGALALEDIARERAAAGSDLLMIFLLKGLMPQKYRERQTIEVNQNVMVQDLRKLPREELVRRLETLRSEQAPAIAGRLIEVDDGADRGNVVALVRREDATDGGTDGEAE